VAVWHRLQSHSMFVIGVVLHLRWLCILVLLEEAGCVAPCCCTGMCPVRLLNDNPWWRCAVRCCAVLCCAVLVQAGTKAWLLLGAAGGAMFGEGTLGFYASKNMVKKVSVLCTHTYSLTRRGLSWDTALTVTRRQSRWPDEGGSVRNASPFVTQLSYTQAEAEAEAVPTVASSKALPSPTAWLMGSRTCPAGKPVHLMMVSMRLFPPGLFK